MEDNRIIKILEIRDHLTQEEAETLFKDVQELIYCAMASKDFDVVEEIMHYELGLEMDYLEDILL